MGRQGTPAGPAVMTSMGIAMPTTKAGKIAYLRDYPGIKSQYRRLFGQRAHRAIVEIRTGIKLPATAVVHHVDPSDKRSNTGLFVVCEDQAYHALLEFRGKALRACGNANWMRCYRCQKWDDPKNLIISPRRKKRRGSFGDVVHPKRDGVCVLPNEPIVRDSYTCEVSPSSRHQVERPHRNRRPYVRTGLTASCSHCAKPVRRPHHKCVRWHATGGAS